MQLMRRQSKKFHVSFLPAIPRFSAL
jgi:hypothetical protein